MESLALGGSPSKGSQTWHPARPSGSRPERSLRWPHFTCESPRTNSSTSAFGGTLNIPHRAAVGIFGMFWHLSQPRLFPSAALFHSCSVI